ncbi:unnamed protein product [Amoebophrya sp. A120]|nr:unnamed protein product [Amoebophrya sp. A120]|eukprot:GSA120T00007225001.1
MTALSPGLGVGPTTQQESNTSSSSFSATTKNASPAMSSPGAKSNASSNSRKPKTQLKKDMRQIWGVPDTPELEEETEGAGKEHLQDNLLNYPPRPEVSPTLRDKINTSAKMSLGSSGGSGGNKAKTSTPNVGHDCSPPPVPLLSNSTNSSNKSNNPFALDGEEDGGDRAVQHDKDKSKAYNNNSAEQHDKSSEHQQPVKTRAKSSSPVVIPPLRIGSMTRSSSSNKSGSPQEQQNHANISNIGGTTTSVQASPTLPAPGGQINLMRRHPSNETPIYNGADHEGIPAPPPITITIPPGTNSNYSRSPSVVSSPFLQASQKGGSLMNSGETHSYMITGGTSSGDIGTNREAPATSSVGVSLSNHENPTFQHPDLDSTRTRINTYNNTSSSSSSSSSSASNSNLAGVTVPLTPSQLTSHQPGPGVGDGRSSCRGPSPPPSSRNYHRPEGPQQLQQQAGGSSSSSSTRASEAAIVAPPSAIYTNRSALTTPKISPPLLNTMVDDGAPGGGTSVMNSTQLRHDDDMDNYYGSRTGGAATTTTTNLHEDDRDRNLIVLPQPDHFVEQSSRRAGIHDQTSNSTRKAKRSESNVSHFFLGTPELNNPNRAEITQMRSQLRQEMEKLRNECREQNPEVNIVSSGGAVHSSSSSSSCSSAPQGTGTRNSFNPSTTTIIVPAQVDRHNQVVHLDQVSTTAVPGTTFLVNGVPSSRSASSTALITTKVTTSKLDDQAPELMASVPGMVIGGGASSTTMSRTLSGSGGGGAGSSFSQPGHPRGSPLEREQYSNRYCMNNTYENNYSTQHLALDSSMTPVGAAVPPHHSSASVSDQELLDGRNNKKILELQSLLQQERKAHERTKSQWKDSVESIRPVLEKLCKLATAQPASSFENNQNYTARSSSNYGNNAVGQHQHQNGDVSISSTPSITVNNPYEHYQLNRKNLFAGQAALKAIKESDIVNPMQLVSTMESIAQALCLWQEEQQDVVQKIFEDMKQLKISKKEVMSKAVLSIERKTRRIEELTSSLERAKTELEKAKKWKEDLEQNYVFQPNSRSNAGQNPVPAAAGASGVRSGGGGAVVPKQSAVNNTETHITGTRLTALQRQLTNLENRVQLQNMQMRSRSTPRAGGQQRVSRPPDAARCDAPSVLRPPQLVHCDFCGHQRVPTGTREEITRGLRNNSSANHQQPRKPLYQVDVEKNFSSQSERRMSRVHAAESQHADRFDRGSIYR